MDQADNNGSKDGKECRAEHGLTHQQDHDDDYDGRDHVDLLEKALPVKFRTLGLRCLLHTQAPGFHIEHEPKGEVIEDCGNQRRLADRRVRNAEEVRHQECRRAHDRRHDRAAGRGDRLRRAGNLVLEARFFHQGNGKGAGGVNIGNGGAGNGTEQTAGENGRLGGTAAQAGSAVGSKVNKELADAACLKEAAKHNEQEHIGGGNIDRRAKQTVRHAEHVGEVVLQADARAADRRGHILRIQRVHNEHRGHNDNRPAGRTAGDLKDQQEGQDDDKIIHRREL